MAIHQMRKQSDLDKRLKILRSQLYGTGKLVDQKVSRSEESANTPIFQSIGSPIHRSTENAAADLAYLYQDLSKIGILATLALGIQIAIFLLIKNRVLNLNLF